MEDEEKSKSKLPLIIGIVVLIIIVILIAVILKKDNKKELTNEIEIIDRCSPNTSGSEVFYSDEEYDYIFYGSKSSCVVAVVNGKEYQINKALEEKLITIDDAKKSGLKFVKEEKKSDEDEDNDSSDEPGNEEEKDDSDIDDNEVVEEPIEDNDEDSNDDVTGTDDPSTNKDDGNNQSSNNNQGSQNNQSNQNNPSKDDNTSNNTLKRIIVYDRCPTVAKNTEVFYSDTNYNYKSNKFQPTCTYVTINDKEYLLKDALDRKLVTIKELEEIGVFFQKEIKDIKPLEPIKGIIIDDRCDITAQAIETFYSDNNYDYQFNSIKSGCIYAIVNGKEYTIKQALDNNIITIEEAEQAGLHFIRKSKNKINY